MCVCVCVCVCLCVCVRDGHGRSGWSQEGRTPGRDARGQGRRSASVLVIGALQLLSKRYR